eukprot:12163145-Karenia_brevis.AAC.1
MAASWAASCAPPALMAASWAAAGNPAAFVVAFWAALMAAASAASCLRNSCLIRSAALLLAFLTA